MVRLIIRIVAHRDGIRHSVDMFPEGNPVLGTLRTYATLTEASSAAISVFIAVTNCGMPAEIHGYYSEPFSKN